MRAIAKQKELQRLSERARGGETCGICLEEFDDPETMTTTLCGHVFHEECMDRLRISEAFRRDPKCPNCRAVLPRAQGDPSPEEQGVEELGIVNIMALIPFQLPNGVPVVVAAGIPVLG